jgi:hypothetical protein
LALFRVSLDLKLNPFTILVDEVKWAASEKGNCHDVVSSLISHHLTNHTAFPPFSFAGWTLDWQQLLWGA